MMDLPKYRCHKVVQAAKIIETGPEPGGRDVALTLQLPSKEVGVVIVSTDWALKHNPQVGGYFIQYEDGYQSYSPAAAFEDGYTAID